MVKHCVLPYSFSLLYNKHPVPDGAPPHRAPGLCLPLRMDKSFVCLLRNRRGLVEQSWRALVYTDWPRFLASTCLLGPSKSLPVSASLGSCHTSQHATPSPPKGAIFSTLASGRMDRIGPEDLGTQRVLGQESDRSRPPSGHPGTGRGLPVFHNLVQPVGNCSGSSGCLQD